MKGDDAVDFEDGASGNRVDLDVDGRGGKRGGARVVLGVDEGDARVAGGIGAEVDGLVPESEGEHV